MQIIEGSLVLPEGVKYSQLAFDRQTGLIGAVGPSLGRAEWSFPESQLIFPGFGDIHVHCREDATGRNNHKETFLSAGRAALNGGCVFLADMPNNPRPPADEAGYREKAALAAAAPVRIILYAGVGPDTRPLPFPAPYKVFLGSSVGSLCFSSAEELSRALERYRGQDMHFHCEDQATLDLNRHQPNHEDQRPATAEAVAVAAALELIRAHGLRGHICHVSCRESLYLIEEARRNGTPVTCEVSPHHLFFDLSMIHPANRRALQVNPPLRLPEDRQALSRALREGRIECLATDHAPHLPAEKQRGLSGIPHLDTYGAFAAWLMRQQGFTPGDILRVCCENPAAAVRPYLPPSCGKGFGRLAPGYMASCTVLDRERPWTVEAADLKTKCGWSPFAGFTFPGSVAAVFHAGAEVTVK